MDPIADYIIKSAIAVVITILIGVVKSAWDKINKLEEKQSKQQESLLLNSQRDSLAESFYDKTIGKELNRMENTLAEIKSDMKEMQQEWNKLIQKLIEKK